MLNRTLERDIESRNNFLDKSTKWAYKQERGVSIFAIYGIGDGTVPTPLYVVGGEQANKDFELLQKYLEARKNGSNRSRSTLIRLLESIESKRGDAGNRVYYDEKGRTADSDVPVSRGQRERDGRADHEGSAEDRGQVKFSTKLPVEQAKTEGGAKYSKKLIGGQFPPYSEHIAKITVEEFFDESKNGEALRAYDLKDIKVVATSTNGVLSLSEGLTDANIATIKSVSDLYGFVKRYDDAFIANDENTSKFVNSDGSPRRMYRGDPNGADTKRKKESAAHEAPAPAEKPLRITDSIISISQLLDFATENFADVLPESVLVNGE
ncbi:MAG: hypothetical protein IJT07_01305 [Oscillospiraceae bacterium]|nr:hypothetical protein [Oscillospiraceae bacterium]